jgi:EAL domain-containing protein (putative c-di-GMP-specific phosphodiesterase class I)
MNVQKSFKQSQQNERKDLLKHDLTHALEHRLLSLVYQPTLDFNERKIVSAEALCRWQHPVLGQIPADEFIEIAESHGLISKLGDCVLDQVLSDLPEFIHKWPRARIAVNVSGHELDESNFAERKITKIESVSTQFFNHLEWEVTETSLIDNIELASRHLHQLRQFGMTIAMDDFGTGESTLERIQQLPFDKIKLDRQFVLNLKNPVYQKSLKSMIELTSNSHQQLVIEGIETEEELIQLTQSGCHMGQGYFFSKPVSFEELLKLKI